MNTQEDVSRALQFFYRESDKRLPIDLDEVRDRVERLLELLQKDIQPFILEHRRFSNTSGEYGMQMRQAVRRGIDTLLRDTIGVISPAEGQFTLDQPLLLVWSSLGSNGGIMNPILIDIARVSNISTDKGLTCSAIMIAQISWEDAVLRKVDPSYRQGIRTQNVMPNGAVVVPLAGGNVSPLMLS
jgi:hypothetical protein